MSDFQSDASNDMTSIADTVDRFCMLLIKLPLPMPCGAMVYITGSDQPCPNSGNCAAGHRQCWIEQYEKAAPCGN